MAEESVGGSAPSVSLEGSTSNTPALSAGTQALQGSTEQQAVEAAIKKYKVKIDGEELDVDEAELLRGYQTTKAAQKRMSEAAQMRQQAEEFIKLAKSDPRKLLTHQAIGVDLASFAEQILAEAIEEQMMSPQEKEFRETKKKLAAFEEERKAVEEQRQQQEIAQLQAQYEADISNKIVAALDTSGLPRSESTVKRMAQYMLLGMQNGLDVQPADVVDLVREDYLNDIKSLFGQANEDILLQMLGDEITPKVVKAHLNKTNKGKATQPRVAPGTVKPDTSKVDATKKAPMSKDQWKKMLDERLKG